MPSSRVRRVPTPWLAISASLAALALTTSARAEWARTYGGPTATAATSRAREASSSA